MGCDDGTLTEDSTIVQWCKLLAEVAEKLQHGFIVTDEFKYIMAEVGFVEIVETRFKWPSNPWPKEQKYKELGAWNNENSIILLEGLTMAPFTRGLGWTRAQVEVFLVDLRKEFNDPKIHAYWPMFVVPWLSICVY